MGRIVLYSLLAFILVALLPGLRNRPFDILVPLLGGWWSFLKRTLPNITWNIDLLGMAAVCVLLILAGGHCFANWIVKHVFAGQAAGQPAKSWPWKWTWCGTAALGVFFLVGMAVGGIAHQTGWMAVSEERMFIVKAGQSDLYNMRHLLVALQTSLLEPNATVSSLRKDSQDKAAGYFGDRQTGNLLDRYHVLLVVETNGAITGAVIFPRDPQRRARFGGLCFLQEESKNEPVPEAKLQSLLKQHGPKLVAL